jgi:phage-related protein
VSIVLNPPRSVSADLAAPATPNDGNYVAQLESKAGIVIGGVDGIVHAITGFSPLEEWVAKPFGGDWQALDRGAAGWSGAAKAITAIKENIDDLPSLIGDSWTGASATAFAKAHKKICTAIEPLPMSLESLSKMCSALAKAAQAIGEFVIEVLEALAEFVVEMVQALATPVVGEAEMPVWVTELLGRVAVWVPELSGMIAKFIALVNEILPIIEEIKAVYDEIKPILDLLSSVGKAAVPVIEATAEADQAVA